jgi:hypothetical protein
LFKTKSDASKSATVRGKIGIVGGDVPKADRPNHRSFARNLRSAWSRASRGTEA